MAKLSEEAKQAIATIRPAFVATANKAGKPNVSPKGSLSVVDDEHVVFANINSPRTIANIKENPQVAIICLDPTTRKGCRIWGTGEIISSGEIFDQTAAELTKRNMKLKNIVKVTVEKAEIN